MSFPCDVVSDHLSLAPASTGAAVSRRITRSYPDEDFGPTEETRMERIATSMLHVVGGVTMLVALAALLRALAEVSA